MAIAWAPAAALRVAPGCVVVRGVVLNQPPAATMAVMASFEFDGPDAPACPLLGLSADRRSHFMYPHPGHRCFAMENPATTDAYRQATYCLSPGYTACDRYKIRQHSVQAGGTTAGAVAGPATVVHVLRPGDSRPDRGRLRPDGREDRDSQRTQPE